VRPADAERAAQSRQELEQQAAVLYAAALARARGAGGGKAVDAAASALATAAKLGAIGLIVAGISHHERAKQLAEDRLGIDEPPTPGDARALRLDAEAWARDVVKEERGTPLKDRPAAVASGDRAAELRARTIATRVAAERALATSEHLISELGLGKGALRSAWVSHGDTRVRELHRKLHGRTRRLGEPFYAWTGTGQKLRYPGDPEAPLDATMGCRCSLWFAWGAEAAAVERALMPPDTSDEAFAASG
jgi:hypothetical protein